jgi:hypothetical protein
VKGQETVAAGQVEFGEGKRVGCRADVKGRWEPEVGSIHPDAERTT